MWDLWTSREQRGINGSCLVSQTFDLCCQIHPSLHILLPWCYEAIAIIGKLFLLLWGLTRAMKSLVRRSFCYDAIVVAFIATFHSCNINNNVTKTFAIVNLLSQFNHTTYFNSLQFSIFLLLCSLLQFAIASTTTQLL
jgi:hypothetical protein